MVPSGTTPFENWGDFKLCIWEHFIPRDEPSRRRTRWEILPHELWKVNLYISKYKWIMSLVLDVDDYDKLHGFLDGLQPTVNERGSGEMGIVNLGGSDRDHRVSG